MIHLIRSNKVWSKLYFNSSSRDRSLKFSSRKFSKLQKGRKLLKAPKRWMKDIDTNFVTNFSALAVYFYSSYLAIVQMFRKMKAKYIRKKNVKNVQKFLFCFKVLWLVTFMMRISMKSELTNNFLILYNMVSIRQRCI